MNDVLVIGAGLSGLVAAWQAVENGRSVRVVAKGWGITHWHAGCIDVLGYYPLDNPEPVVALETAVSRLATEHPQHPYALIRLDNLQTAIEAFKALCATANYPLHGSLTRNWLLPSALGTFRPTCLAPATMIAGDLTDNTPMLIVGFSRWLDFAPALVADNLTHQGIQATHVTLDLPSLRQRKIVTALTIANLMETPAFRAELVNALKPYLSKAGRIGFPAVLGYTQATAVHQTLQKELGRPVFEIPTLPPSIPGMRLHHILLHTIRQKGGMVLEGLEATAATTQNGRITGLYTSAATRHRLHHAHHFILATGGILGGGITTNYTGEITETIFNLPLSTPVNRQSWFRRDFLDPQGHPIYQTGVRVNQQLQPLNENGQPIYENLQAIGTILANWEPIRERSLEGVALATGFIAGRGKTVTSHKTQTTSN